MTEKRFVMYEHKDNDYILDTPNTSLDFIEMLGDALSSEEIVDLLNEQDEQIRELLKYKYLVKALEEVSGSHYIEEIISDYTDGAVSDEKEQLELGKWHSEHGLSWENGDVE